MVFLRSIPLFPERGRREERVDVERSGDSKIGADQFPIVMGTHAICFEKKEAKKFKSRSATCTRGEGRGGKGFASGKKVYANAILIMEEKSHIGSANGKSRDFLSRVCDKVEPGA